LQKVPVREHFTDGSSETKNTLAFSVPLLKRVSKREENRLLDKKLKRGESRKNCLACLGVYEFSAVVKILEEKGFDIKEFLAKPRWQNANFLPERNDDMNPQSVFEQAGFAARHMMEKMADFGVVDGPIFATGGWSRSLSLLELRASIYAQPVYYLEEPEPAAVGAALLGLDCHGAGSCHIHGYDIIAPNAALIPLYEEGYQRQQ